MGIMGTEMILRGGFSIVIVKLPEGNMGNLCSLDFYQQPQSVVIHQKVAVSCLQISACHIFLRSTQSHGKLVALVHDPKARIQIVTFHSF
jgi:hypothetical protein